ncbi:Predicted Zn-dependent protease, minimal metalloprotease (MMP)-like domain [Arthrobacter sp. yr096]|uniref:metallopeptidase family protein n=1 Tax=unclassified Arthrobacter TaxID=235627 RepID=UPI0008953A85|nr:MULTISPECIES: metallopeptidase family protein [unclassified Arthrobacter]SDX46193.1 Predicted Zn-dependent protease, minimal metalloprotease (MMP)-like domain [Arthrobacter sp. cf158]SEJ46440.1 Predicted Zn-dependent protease, minimal metalloprotease (MMP)-like domain [Arthrobacter sp. yr096]
MPANLPPGLPIVPDGDLPSSPLRERNAVHSPVEQAPGDPVETAGFAGPFEMSPEDFEEAVSDALQLIPPKAAGAMDNVAIFIEDDYTPQPGEDPGTVLLGLYEGVPLTERDSWWDAGSLPDRITIFRQPILNICSTRQEVIDEVAITVVHEIAHHFGIDDDRLHELGWG